MMAQGGFLHRRVKFSLAAMAVVMVGWFGIDDLGARLESQTTSQLPDRPVEVLIPLQMRLTESTDPNQLLHLGHWLLKKHEIALAQPVLERAHTLAPENRDINLLLAWMFSSSDMEQARRYLATAATVDPLHPDIRGLQTLFASLDQSGKSL